jgi:hypothetical protein
MTELIMMLTIPPAVGLITYALVRWMRNKDDRNTPVVPREPRLN